MAQRLDLPRQLLLDFNLLNLPGTMHESYYHSAEHKVYNFANLSGGTNIAILVRYPQTWIAWTTYYIGDVVWGTDGLQYTPRFTHKGGDDTQPITGGSWEVGWKLLF